MSARPWCGLAHPSLLVTLAVEHGIANPAIILDEVEKAGRSTAGSVHEPLLCCSSGARRGRGAIYVDAQCDLSHLNWLFTANSLQGVPAPLRNRVRVLRMPQPGREHVPALAPRVLREILVERGVDPHWEPPLDGEELAAVAEAFGQQGSVRDLQRFVEGVLDARAAMALRN